MAKTMTLKNPEGPLVMSFHKDLLNPLSFYVKTTEGVYKTKYRCTTESSAELLMRGYEDIFPEGSELDVEYWEKVDD